MQGSLVAKVKLVAYFAGIAIVIAAIACAIEALTGFNGTLLLVLFIFSPLICDIALGLLGKRNEVVGFLIFPTVGFGCPALVVYWALKAIGW